MDFDDVPKDTAEIMVVDGRCNRSGYTYQRQEISKNDNGDVNFYVKRVDSFNILVVNTYFLDDEKGGYKRYISAFLMSTPHTMSTSNRMIYRSERLPGYFDEEQFKEELKKEYIEG